MHPACACVSTFLGEAACQVLFPETFGRLRQWHGARRVWSAGTLARAEAKLEAALSAGGDLEGNLGNLTIQSRVKSLKSVFEKIILRGHTHVDDLLALRVIVEPSKSFPPAATSYSPPAATSYSPPAATSYSPPAAQSELTCVERCRQVEALVHAIWPGRVESTKDYVNSPKANGYQSIHLAVRLHNGEKLEVQIRTRCMHEHAEHGIANHAQYKAGSFLQASWPDNNVAIPDDGLSTCW